MKKYLSEFIGTFILVLFGCGSAVVTGNIVAISLAFGISIIAIAYSVGRISGGHVNPAVSLAMLINKKMTIKDFIGYVIAQVLGAFAASGMLYFILHNTNYPDLGLGANGYGTLSSIGIGLPGALVLEIVATFIFVIAILGVTNDEKFEQVSGVVIGAVLALVHIFLIPFTGTSVNPARSLAPAVLTGGDALMQVWVFIVAPLVGAALAAFAWKYISKTKED